MRTLDKEISQYGVYVKHIMRYLIVTSGVMINYNKIEVNIFLSPFKKPLKNREK